jgi:chorismate synthase
MSFLESAAGGIEIRELSGLDELGEAERLQLDVWGQDTIPEGRELLLAIQHAGGLVAGGFDGSGQMAGFVFAFPSRDPAVQHSHRLAVRPQWRGQGLGAALKWFQRDWCLRHNIRFVEWTVDPLRMPNAELNARILGATTRTYLLDFYGAMQGIDAGLPSDRFHMTWDLSSPRVSALAAGRAEMSDLLNIPWINQVEEGLPAVLRLDLDVPLLLAYIPRDFVRLAASERASAAAWRLHTRQLFQTYFARGYSVCGFTSSAAPAYLLERTTP